MKKSISLLYTTHPSSLPWLGCLSPTKPTPMPLSLWQGLHLPGVQLHCQFPEDFSPPEKLNPPPCPDLHQCPASFLAATPALLQSRGDQM